MEKSRKLTIEEFRLEEEKWLNKNEEYFSKLIDINKKEKQIVQEKFKGNADRYLYSADAANLNKERAQIKQHYKGYVCNFLDPDFYCVLTNNQDLEKIVIEKKLKHLFAKDLVNIGKVVKSKSIKGIFEGIACSVEDYYYLIKNENDGNEAWCSCLDMLSLVKN